VRARLYLVHLGGHDHGVGLLKVGLRHRLIVKGARMLVRVAVQGAKHIVTSALEAQQSDLLVARPAPRRVGLYPSFLLLVALLCWCGGAGCCGWLWCGG